MQATSLSAKNSNPPPPLIMDKLKTKRAAAASLAVLLVGVPVGILALAISKAVKACKRPANEEAENFLAESEGE